jgi:hypothetical protein
MSILAPVVPPDALEHMVAAILIRAGLREPHRAPAHRALADAQDDRRRWLTARAMAQEMADRYLAERV